MMANPRPRGNSTVLAAEAARRAEEAGPNLVSRTGPGS